ncbi:MULTISPECIES: VOC family protein [Cytobacillus]|uniref:VOC family protein n=1 Tax=Cytobacillus stercorigallinarum TaxID=2762240 RepID=A0ABR8QLH4_9BACI|nr:VOC family protein [Cytobacillus stercorigallinarum]MBD7936327.1 VOC family protein [Cytobacillus stercorigallinarum]
MKNELFQGTIDHTGIVVPNLREAVTFFTEVLNFEVLFQAQPMKFEDDRLKQSFGVHEKAFVEGAAFLQYGGKKIELVQWTDPEQNSGPKPADIGTAHLAISVTDLKKAYTYFENTPGVSVRVFSPIGFFYITSPWGLEIQIVGTEQSK